MTLSLFRFLSVEYNEAVLLLFHAKPDTSPVILNRPEHSGLIHCLTAM